MRYYHGHQWRKNWFESWIFKFQKESKRILFIPKIQFDEKKGAAVFLYIILDKLYSYSFFIDDFNCEDNQLSIRIQNCFFTERGCSLNLQTEALNIKGRINYELKPSNSLDNFINSFSSLHQHHQIISAFHSLSGALIINSEEWDFNDGMGYIEMNWGKEGNKEAIWNQSLWQADKINSISVMAVRFSFFNIEVKTCMIALCLEELQLFLNAPLQAKILKMNSEELIVVQKGYRFELRQLSEQASFLSRVQYRLYINEDCVLSKEIEQSHFYLQLNKLI